MFRPPKRRWVWLLSALLVMFLLVGLLGSIEEIDWVGSKDLEIEFVTADADTGQPVPEATIDFRGEGQEFRLVTDAAGSARRWCQDCLCCGVRTINPDALNVRLAPFYRVKNTFHIMLPEWWLQVSAPGYATSEVSVVDSPDYQQRVRRGKDFASLRVPIPLRKGPSPVQGGEP